MWCHRPAQSIDLFVVSLKIILHINTHKSLDLKIYAASMFPMPMTKKSHFLFCGLRKSLSLCHWPQKGTTSQIIDQGDLVLGTNKQNASRPCSVSGFILQHRGDSGRSQRLPVHGGRAAPAWASCPSWNWALLPALCESCMLSFTFPLFLVDPVTI